MSYFRTAGTCKVLSLLVTTDSSSKIMPSSEIKTISGLLDDEKLGGTIDRVYYLWWNSAWQASASQVTREIGIKCMTRWYVLL